MYKRVYLKYMKKAKAFFKKPIIKSVLRMVITLVIVASVTLNVFTYVIPIVRHYGNSMSPTLTDDQILVVLKTDDVSDGDIIAFYYNNKVLVRRVIASAGEQVSIDIFGTVSVNGKELDEPYVSDKTLGQSNLENPFDVPANSFFVLGDNRVTSMDSRLEEIGAVAKERIIGKVVFSLYPPGTVG